LESFTKPKKQRIPANSEFYDLPRNDEPITVFATHKSDYRADGTARHTPFMPSKKYGNTSCFRIINLPFNKIWEISEKHVKNQNITNIYGRFDFYAESVIQLNLSFEPDNTPPRHANIINWPDGDKQAIKSKAQQIAATSIFHCQVHHDSFVAQASYDKEKKTMTGSLKVANQNLEFSADKVKELPSQMDIALRTK